VSYLRAESHAIG